MAKISSARQFKAILRKDIVMELRTGEMLTSMGLYAVLVLIVYGVALSQAGSSFDVQRIAAGLLWLAILFTSMLGLNRSLVHEKDQGCLDALLLSPVDRPIIFFAKATGNLIFLSDRRGDHPAALLLPVPLRQADGGPVLADHPAADCRDRSESQVSARCLRLCR